VEMTSADVEDLARGGAEGPCPRTRYVAISDRRTYWIVKTYIAILPGLGCRVAPSRLPRRWRRSRGPLQGLERPR
jgi:hypothetical protein